MVNVLTKLIMPKEVLRTIYDWSLMRQQW